MNFNIDHYPNKEFDLFSLKIDLNHTFTKKLGKEKLTNALALKILKQIKWESDALSFLTKPVIFFPLTVAILASNGLKLPDIGIALTVITKIVRIAIGTGIVFISLRHYASQFLSHLSQAYSDQSKRAAEYIQKIESADQEFAFNFN